MQIQLLIYWYLSSGTDSENLGFTIDEAVAAVQDKANEALLDKYRDALGLWEEHTRDTGSRVIITLDGRDTAGKGSNITRVTKDLKTSRFKGVAFPGIPSDEEKYRYNWFQRYSDEFPDSGELRFFDRSWYNRAFVEAAMGFATEEEYNWFMKNVNQFEKDQIVEQGISFVKVYLSITKDIQKHRLHLRKRQRKKWKSSPIDEQAQEKWRYYTLAKMKALELTDTKHAPWLVINSEEKFLSAIEIMKHIISTTDDIKKLVENDLGISLKLDPKITRSAKDELHRMEKKGHTENIPDAFKFSTEQKEFPKQKEFDF